MRRCALAVRHDLNLDMPGAMDEALEIHRSVRKRGARTRHCARKTLAQIGLRFTGHHADPAAPGGGFDHDGPAEAAGGREGGLFVRNHRAPGDDRNARLEHEAARSCLVPHLRDGIGRGTNPGRTRGADGARERCVLGEEAVAGMHRVGPARSKRAEERLHLEIRLARGRRSDGERDVGLAYVRGLGIGLRVHRHSLNPKRPARANHAPRDLPPVGDQHPTEHGSRFSTPRRSPPSQLPARRCLGPPATLPYARRLRRNRCSRL